jgi:hypothetical protein
MGGKIFLFQMVCKKRVDSCITRCQIAANDRRPVAFAGAPTTKINYVILINELILHVKLIKK